jgi:transmembrane sensor
MNAHDRTTKEWVPHERLAEAGVWIARLHADERDRTVEAGFRLWLQANPLNGRAFELATEVWEDAGGLRRALPPVFSTPRRHRFRIRIVSACATAVVATVLVFIGISLYLRTEGVATDVGEQRLLTLEDGTRVFLNTATRVVVSYDKIARRVELKSGEALFNVAKRSDWPFIVIAGDRQVRALGTSFVVRRDEQRLAVTLVDGKVMVLPVNVGDSAHNAAGDSVKRAGVTRSSETFTLSPGQRLTLSGHEAAQLDTPSLDGAIAWRRGQVVLDDTALAAAAAEMNRYSSVKLVIEQPEAKGLLVNGLFQAGDSASFANAVSQTYGLKVIDKGSEIVLAGTPRAAGPAVP